MGVSIQYFKMAHEKFCLRWNDFESNIGVAFRELREDQEFFDVTLACDEDQIQAHKVILSVWCSALVVSVVQRSGVSKTLHWGLPSLIIICKSPPFSYKNLLWAYQIKRKPTQVHMVNSIFEINIDPWGCRLNLTTVSLVTFDPKAMKQCKQFQVGSRLSSNPIQAL